MQPVEKSTTCKTTCQMVGGSIICVPLHDTKRFLIENYLKRTYQFLKSAAFPL